MATATLDRNFALAQEEYKGKIRTFARNSYYKMPGFTTEDVEQELLVVLWDCVRTYNPDKGAKFNTFFQQSAKNKIVSLIRYFEAKTRVANSMVVTLEDDAVRFAIEEDLGGATAEDIALQRMELQAIYEKHGLEAILNPKRRRRAAKDA